MQGQAFVHIVSDSNDTQELPSGSILGSIQSLSSLDNSAQPESEDIQTFINYTKSILRKVGPDIPEPEE
jgi:hypothetical protein